MKKYRLVLFIVSVIFTFTLIISVLTLISKEEIVVPQVSKPIDKPVQIMRPIKEVSIETNIVEDEVFEAKFSSSIISQEVLKRIHGKSYQVNEQLKLRELRYLSLSYYGFDDQSHQGEMIVHKSVAEEVLEIFQELYEAEYPIEIMSLVDDYEADDNLSMAANNTSAFNFRLVTGSSKLSMHAYGLAIDINPIQNPYVKGEIILPPEGSDYVQREIKEKGMILKDDICYQAFTSRGWTWGGDWQSLKDYQHFEKSNN